MIQLFQTEKKRIVEKRGAGSTVQELDENMLIKYDVIPHFCWRERNAQGELVVKYSTTPPKNGEYTYMIYQNP